MDSTGALGEPATCAERVAAVARFSASGATAPSHRVQRPAESRRNDQACGFGPIAPSRSTDPRSAPDAQVSMIGSKHLNDELRGTGVAGGLQTTKLQHMDLERHEPRSLQAPRRVGDIARRRPCLPRGAAQNVMCDLAATQRRKLVLAPVLDRRVVLQCKVLARSSKHSGARYPPPASVPRRGAGAHLAFARTSSRAAAMTTRLVDP
jgi:hypothetical protein